MKSDNHRERKLAICDRIRSRKPINNNRRPITDVLEVKLEATETTLTDVFFQAIKDHQNDSEIHGQLVAAIRFGIS